MKPLKESGLHFFVMWSNAHASGDLKHGPIRELAVAEAVGNAWRNEMIECDEDPESAADEYQFEVIERNAHTLAEWNVKGYLVCEGAKAVGHDANGHALFLETQVVTMRDKPPEASINPFSF